MLSFSLVAEALTGLIYHRPSGENSKFLPSFLVLNCMLDSLVNTHHLQDIRLFHYTTGHHGLCQIKQRWNETSFPEQSVCKAKGVKQWSSLLGMWSTTLRIHTLEDFVLVDIAEQPLFDLALWNMYDQTIDE